MSKVITCAVTAVLMSLVLWSWAPEARADTTSLCTVSSFEFHANTNGSVDPRLMVKCNNDTNIYVAAYAGTSCSLQPVELVKMWASLVSAAYLSGRTLTINWSVPSCGQDVIQSIFL